MTNKTANPSAQRGNLPATKVDFLPDLVLSTIREGGGKAELVRVIGDKVDYPFKSFPLMVIGSAGMGKSYLAVLLGKQLGCKVIHIDNFIVKKGNKYLTDLDSLLPVVGSGKSIVEGTSDNVSDVAKALGASQVVYPIADFKSFRNMIAAKVAVMEKRGDEGRVLEIFRGYLKFSPADYSKHVLSNAKSWLTHLGAKTEWVIVPTVNVREIVGNAWHEDAATKVPSKL